MTEVGAIIETGHAIPNDVTEVEDCDADRWNLTEEGWDLAGSPDTYRGKTSKWLAQYYGRLTVTAVREPEPTPPGLPAYVAVERTLIGECPAHGVHPHPNGVEPVNLCLDCPQCRPVAQTVAAIDEPDEVVHYRIPGDASPLTLCGLDVWADDTSVTERAGSSNCTGCRAAADEGKMREPACPHGYEAEKWCDKCTPPAPSVLLDLVRQHGQKWHDVASGVLDDTVDGAEVGSRISDANVLFDRIAALVPQPADTVKATQRALLDEIASLLDVGAYDDLAAEVKRLLAPADPSVLSLPTVPPEAVALVGGRRWVRSERAPEKWKLADGPHPHALAGLGAVLDTEGPVTVVMREPRTWPRLDAAPDDLRSFKGASGKKYMRHQLQQLDRWHAQGNDAEDWRPMAYWQQVDGPLEEVFE